MKRLLYLALLLIATASHAQQFSWLKTPEINLDLNPDMVGYTVATDPESNVYYTGFKDGAFPYVDILGNLYYNKYNSGGDLVFSKTISGKAIIYNMVSDGSGNIVIALGFNDTVTIDGTTLTETDGGMHYVLIKFDSNGNRLWHHQFSIIDDGFETVTDLRAIAIDESNNIYAGYDHFAGSRITKFSPTGTAIFTIEQLNVRRVTSLGVDELGNIFAAGGCAGTDNGDFNGTIVSSGLQYNTYLVKYSPQGDYQWVKFVEDVTCSEPKVAVHSQNDIYFTSWLFGTYPFDEFVVEGATSNADFFLAKLNANGQYQWVRDVPGEGAAGPGRNNYLAVDDVGNAYFSGFTQGSIDWGNGITTSTVQSGRLSLLLKYAPDGTILSAITAGGGFGRADAVAIGSDGAAYIAGMGYGESTFGAINYDGAGDQYYTYLAKLNFGTLNSDNIEKPTIGLFPNPATHTVSISVQGVNASGAIYNALGQRVMEFPATKMPLDVSSLTAGAYLVVIDGLGTARLIRN